MLWSRPAKIAVAVGCAAALGAASCGQTSTAPTSETVSPSPPDNTSEGEPAPTTEVPGAGSTAEVVVPAETPAVPVVAFVDVAVVTMTADVVEHHQTVLVEGDRITAVGPVGDVDVTDGALVIDGRNAFLMPGLADLHVHLDDVWPVPMLDLFLASGVTTVRNMNGRDPTVLTWRDEVVAGTRRGPTIFTAGPTIYEDARDLDAVVADQLDRGYDFVKLYSFLSPEGFAAAMAAVRDHGAYAVGHVPFAVGLDGVIEAGMDEIAHIEELTFELVEFDRSAEQLGIDGWLAYIFEQAEAELQSPGIEALMAERVGAVVDSLRGVGVPIATTAFLSELIVEKLMHPDTFLARPELAYMPATYLAEFAAGVEKHQVQFAGHEDISALRYAIVLALVEALHEADVPLVLGTDAGTGHMGLVPGFTIHDELATLTAHGLTPYEAILTGTVNASAAVAAMTGHDDFGTIAVGKRADLILVGENPLDDVSHIEEQLLGVMAAGTWYAQPELSELITL